MSPERSARRPAQFPPRLAIQPAAEPASRREQEPGLEVLRLGHADERRVIAAGAAALEQLEWALGFLRSPGNHFAEQLRRDAARAGAGDEQAAGLQQAHRAVVDLAIGAERAIEAVLALREGGRVEDDGCKFASLFIESAQSLDCVSRAGFDILQT